MRESPLNLKLAREHEAVPLHLQLHVLLDSLLALSGDWLIQSLPEAQQTAVEFDWFTCQLLPRLLDETHHPGARCQIQF